jgi:hypothetical protein
MPRDSEDDSPIDPGTFERPIADEERVAEFRDSILDAGLAYAEKRRPGSQDEAFTLVAVGTVSDGLRQLLELPGSLVDAELDSLKHLFLSQLAKRRSHWIPQSESNLLLKINEPFPIEKQEKLLALVDKRDETGLDDSERAELVALADEIQGYEQSRLEALSKLAIIRGVSLEELSEQVQSLSTRPK